MRALRRALVFAGFGLLGLLLILALAFGLAQTRPGKAWLAAVAGRALSDATDRVEINHVGGLVPFDMTIGAVTVSDAQGSRILINDAAVVVAPAALLRGRLILRQVSAREVRVERGSQGSEHTDLSSLLHLPLPITIDRLKIDRLAFGPAILGEPMALALAASGSLASGQASADVDLHRIDGALGEARLHLAFGGTPLRLTLAADVAEPTGRFLAGLLAHPKPLPLALHLTGDGPLADWQGRLTATAGDAGALDLAVNIRGNAGYRARAEGNARLAQLLPPRLQPLIGDDARISATLDIADDATTLENLRLAVAAGTVSAHGRYERANDGVSGAATVAVPNLAAFAPLVDRDMSGTLTAELKLGGTLEALTAHVETAGGDLGFDGNRAAEASAAVDLQTLGDPFSASTAVDVSASGRLGGVTLAATALPGDLGKELDWRLALRLDRQTQTIALSELALEDGGSTLRGEGNFAAGAIDAKAHLLVPDIARFAGPDLSAALGLDADFRATADGAASALLDGTLRPSPEGTSMLKALLGNQATLAARLERSADGTLRARDIAVNGDALGLTGTAERAADGRIAAAYHVALPRLAALDERLAGSAELKGEVTGPSDALAATVSLTAGGISAGSLHLDELMARLVLARLNEPSGRIEATFRAQGFSGSAASDVALSHDVLRLTGLRLDAAGTRVDGALALKLVNHTMDGTLAASVPDLKPWSALVGEPLSGSAQLKATLAGARGQSIDLTLDGKALSWSAAPPVTAQRLHVNARLTDVFATPAGRVDLQLDNAKRGSASLSQLRLSAQSGRPGRFMLDGTARGTVGEPVSLAVKAETLMAEDRIELRVTQLTGKLGDQPVLLRQPLLLSRRNSALAFRDLALAIGNGSISGAGSLQGDALSLRLHGAGLGIGRLAALAGQKDVTGAIGFDITLSGTRQRPQGDIVLSADELRFAAVSRPDLPPVALVASATWRGDRVNARGRVEGPQNAAVGFTAALPLTLDPKSLVPRLPPQGAIAFHLEGDGELANLVDLLALGEDRLAGHFVIDVSVGGTVAQPNASGQLTLRNGRYESLATGLVLAGLNFDLVGNHDRLVLQSFTASDGERGTLALSGSVSLAAPGGPAFDLAGQLTTFHLLRLDQANATASGEARLTDAIAAPHLAAKLRVDGAELRVPEHLPENIQPISVTTIDSATGETLSTPSEAEPKPWLAMRLDVAVDLPGQVFVRGRGLDSEWRGHLTATGTTAAPQLAGRLEIVRGTYDFLGKSATLSRGIITFLGGKRIDPAVDIEARVSSSDVTAIVQISGTAREPKVALSSQPALPQDEILSRVLFGTSISQISTGQGLELAQAAAALATGNAGAGVLDRLRQGLGLDRLTLGSAQNTSTSLSSGVPTLSATPGIPGSAPSGGVGTSPLGVTGASGSSSPTGSAGVSAGKYVASGVYVGVTQGTTAGSSSVNVQIDVTRHITLNTTGGQASGAGVGVDWKIDY